MIVNLDGNKNLENEKLDVFIIQLATGKIICKIEENQTELIDPCEVQYMQSPQGLMINFLPVGMFTGKTRLYLENNNSIIWMEQAKESMVDSYKKALQDFKLKGGKTEESDIIIAEKIILK